MCVRASVRVSVDVRVSARVCICARARVFNQIVLYLSCVFFNEYLFKLAFNRIGAG